MIRGIGIDVLSVDRIARSMENPRFLSRMFTEGEQVKIMGGGPSTAAGIFAAKEAVVKALGTGFDGIAFHDVEVAWSVKGQPEAKLTGGAAARLSAVEADRVHLSISHDGGRAVAIAVLEGE